MDPEDYLEPEVAVTAAVVAALVSPRVRKLMRQGLVYGTAGVLMAGDTIISFARSMGRSFDQTKGMVGGKSTGTQPEAAVKGSGG